MKKSASFLLLLLMLVIPLEGYKKTFNPDIYRFPDLPQFPGGEVAFINGINHKPERAVRCSFLLSNIAGGYNVYTVYNPTDGLFGDLKKCYHELFKFKTTVPIEKLQEKWDAFFVEAKASEKFLQFCHSQGAIQVRNALLKYPAERRKRIVVVAIAPAAYITEEICCRAYHYVSRRDIVPLFDGEGLKKARKTVCLLTPHRDAAFFDHHFLSPTYRPAIVHHLQAYIKNEGRWQ